VKNIVQKSNEPSSADAGLHNVTVVSFGPLHLIRTCFVLGRTVGCLCPVVEIYMFVDKDQHTKKSEWFLLEPVIYSTRLLDVDVAMSVRRRSLS